MPDDNIPTNKDIDGIPSSVIEEINRRVPLDSLRGEKSLRHIAPSYWHNDGKSLSISSVIASYGIGPIEKKVPADAAQFIKENCRSARRLRTISISAYESFASIYKLPSWASIGTMPFIALTAGVSMLDALACVLWGATFREAPNKEEDIPGMKSLRKKLREMKHPLHDSVNSLLEMDWCKMLYEARNRVVHRGFWPAMEKAGDFVLYQELEDFEFGARTVPRPKKERTLDLVAIMRGLLCELEAWEAGIAPILRAHAFTPYVEGATHLQAEIDGQAECDWCINIEFSSHNPTNEFMEEWKAHQEKTSTSSSESDGEEPLRGQPGKSE